MLAPDAAPLHALHVTISVLARYGGPARSVPALASAQRDAGVEATLFAPAADGHHPLATLPANVPVEFFPASCDAEGLPQSTPTLRAMLNEHVVAGHTVIHDHGCWRPTGRAAARAARDMRAPLVVAPRGMLAPVALAERPWRKRLALALWLRRDLASAALLHATSLREAEELAAMRLGPPIAVLPSGVTVPTDAALHADDTEERLCVFIGRLAPIKQLSLLLDAWARIRPAGWRLVIVGPDERGHGAELAARATALSLEASVTFAGVADDAAKWAWYARADLAVLTSRNESFGLAVAEALAAGVPVVATAGVPWPSLRSEDCGWHVADADFSDALAAATAASAATRRAMGARGRALMMRDYAWPAIATRSASCYRWLLSGGPTPSAVIT